MLKIYHTQIGGKILFPSFGPNCPCINPKIAHHAPIIHIFGLYFMWSNFVNGFDLAVYILKIDVKVTW